MMAAAPKVVYNVEIKCYGPGVFHWKIWYGDKIDVGHSGSFDLAVEHVKERLARFVAEVS